MERPALLLEHQRISDHIAGKHRALCHLLPNERRAKVETFLSAQGSDKVRTNAADQASLHLTTQVLELRSEIDASILELENIRLQLHYST